jgi:hypothetical protein
MEEVADPTSTAVGGGARKFRVALVPAAEGRFELTGRFQRVGDGGARGGEWTWADGFGQNAVLLVNPLREGAAAPGPAAPAVVVAAPAAAAAAVPPGHAAAAAVPAHAAAAAPAAAAAAGAKRSTKG